MLRNSRLVAFRHEIRHYAPAVSIRQDHEVQFMVTHQRRVMRMRRRAGSWVNGPDHPGFPFSLR